MALNNRDQVDLFRDAGLPQTRITELEQPRVKELLGDLMLLVMDADAGKVNRGEMESE